MIELSRSFSFLYNRLNIISLGQLDHYFTLPRSDEFPNPLPFISRFHLLPINNPTINNCFV